jgi:PAS domain S-box-containing protein
MTLRQRTLLMLGIAVIALNAVLYTIASTLLFRNVQQTEEQDIKKQLNSVISVVNQALEQFNRNFSDWAIWDDAYAFVQNGDPKFIQSNLIEGQLATNQINLIAFIQPSGRITFGTGFNLQTKQKMPIPHELRRRLVPSDRLLQHPNLTHTLSGIVSLPEGNMMIISRPILTSEGKGPIRGTLVVGRYLDQAEVERLAKITRLKLDIQPIATAPLPDHLQTWRQHGNSDAAMLGIQAVNADMIAGYALFQDIYGQPAIVVRTESDRTIYRQGQTTLRFLAGSMLGTGIIFCIATLLLLERLVLSRLAKLSQEVSSISQNTLSSRVSQLGQDELSALAVGINAMLANLETYEHNRQQSVVALQQSERKFRNLFENSQVGIFRIRMDDSMILDANQQFIAMTGYPAATVIGQKRTTDFYRHLEDRQRAREQLARSGELQNFEVQLRRQDGSTFWGLFSARLDRESGCVDGVIADISDRKRIEDELRSLFSAMPDVIMVFDQQGYCRKLIATQPQLLVKPSEDQVNRSLYEIHPPDLAQFFHRSIQEALSTQRILNVEYSLEIADRVMWFTSSISPLSENTVLWIARDITDRKSAEEALRQSEATKQAIINAIPDLLLRVQRDGTYLEILTSKHFRVRLLEKLQVGSSVFDSLPADLAHRRVHYIQKALAAGELQIYEQQIEIEDQLREEEVRVVPSLDDEVLVIVRDISDRKAIEAALRRSVAAAEAANRAKSVFLSNMSHELRTPLNIILGFSQLLLRGGSINGQQKEYLDTINRGGEHLLTLINDVLEMAKIEAGRVSFTPIDLDLYKLLDWVQQMFQMKAQSKGLQLLLERAPNLPQFIHTDESKLRQVLVNLVGNAVKFTQQGEIALRVKQGEMHGETDPLTLLFEVEDTGPGIAVTDISRLFQPFVQTESGQKAHEGTGLGLAISQKFVNLMGGEITVSSTVGMGTVFRFAIQTALAAPMPALTTVPRLTVIGLAADQPAYRILIVEDKAENRQILRELLTPVGFAVREAVNGLEAIACWEQWQPHLIWMDIRMPVMDGYEATQRIKAMSRERGQVPIIIAVTGSVFEKDRKVALEMGCSDFVRKPFQVEIIFEKMAEFLGVRYRYAPTEPDQPPVEVGSTFTPSPSSAPSPLTAAALSAMSAEWLNELHQAASRANTKQLLNLIAQIPSAHDHLITTLKDLVNDFCFEEIVAVLLELEKSQH